MFSQADLDERLQASVENGFEQLWKEDDTERRLQYLDQIDRDLKRSWAINRLDHSRELRSEFQAEIDRRKRLEAQRLAEAAAEKAKRDALRQAEIAATEAKEKARLDAERRALEKAEADRQAEEERRAEEERQRIAEQDRLREEQERRQEEERRKAALEAQRQWQAERICRNPACTSWILP